MIDYMFCSQVFPRFMVFQIYGFPDYLDKNYGQIRKNALYQKQINCVNH